MVICGPCIMMPMSGAFNRRETRIPLPNHRSGQEIEPNSQCHQTKTRLPVSVSNQEIIKKPPPLIPLNTDTNRNQNGNFKPGRAFQEETRNKLQRNLIQGKSESLVLANGQGKYVGTKPLKSQNISLNRASNQNSLNPDRRVMSTALLKNRAVRDRPNISAQEDTGSTRKLWNNDNKCVSPRNKEILQVHLKSDTLVGSKTSSGKIPSRNVNSNFNKKPSLRALGLDETVTTKNVVSTIPRRVFIPKPANTRHSIAGVNVTKKEFPTTKDHALRYKSNKELMYTTGLKSEFTNKEQIPNQEKLRSINSHANNPRITATKSVGLSSSRKISKVQSLSTNAENKVDREIATDAEAETADVFEDITELSFAGNEELICDDTFIRNLVPDMADDFDDTDSDGTTCPNNKPNTDSLRFETLNESDDDTCKEDSTADFKNTKKTKHFDEHFASTNYDIVESKVTISPISSPELSHTSTEDFLIESFQKLRAEVGGKNYANCGGGLENETSEQRRASRNHPDDMMSENLTQKTQKLFSQEDDCDYIEIDCEVEPMPALDRPLVYGYSRLLASDRTSLPHRNSLRFKQRNLNNDQDGNSFHPSGLRDVEESHLIPNHCKETYRTSPFDLNKSNGMDRITCLESAQNEYFKNGFCPSEQMNYDPEFMLAQAIHPKSLKNATFSEYSSHIKSSIMERYTYHYNNDWLSQNIKGEYGSCFDLFEASKQQVNSIDPGYYSESDVIKLKEDTFNQTLSESENEENDCFPSYPSTVSHRLSNHNRAPYLFSPLGTEYNGVLKRLVDETPSPCSSNSYSSQNKFPRYNRNKTDSKSNNFLGENPWIHLLPNSQHISPRLQGPIHNGHENKTSASNSATRPARHCSSSAEENGDSSSLFSQRGFHKENSSKPKAKNGHRNSFLPTFFRKKSPSIKEKHHAPQFSPNSNSSRPQRATNSNTKLLPTHSSKQNIEKTANQERSQIANSSENSFAASVSPITKKSNVFLSGSVPASERSTSEKSISERSTSERSTSSSSSSSSTKSYFSTSSQDSVLTVIPAKYL